MRGYSDCLMREHKHNPGIQLDLAARQTSLALIAEMVARLVTTRPVAASEVPLLVASVAATVAQLLDPPSASLTGAQPGKKPNRPQPKQKPAKTDRRSRTWPTATVETPMPAPPAPRLVRRAEAVVAPPAEIMPFRMPATPGRVRGIVRWFDPARQTGALRLPGSSEDVPIEPGVFEHSGIARLFKGQEIDAELDRGDAQVRIAAIALPGAASAGPSKTGMVTGGRRPRMVIVEKKRDGLKRAAVRSTAERMLGTPIESEDKSR